MNPYQVSRDPIWYLIVDGLVILLIGIAAGIVIAQTLFVQEITTTEVRGGVQTLPQIESGASTDIPSGVQIDEI